MPFLLAATLTSLAAVAVDAPVTAVTVYSDRARVTRTGSVALSGTEKVDLPLLVEGVDPATIWVDAKGAEVRRVDVARIEAEEFPRDEARAVLGKLEAVDDKIARASGDRAAVAAALEVVRRMTPAAPAGDALRPPPKLNPTGWAAALAFVASWTDKLQARVRDLDLQLGDLGRERSQLVEQARLIGGARRTAGYRVSPTLHGQGKAEIALSYAIAGARWYPIYDIQLLPDQGKVQLAFAGRVSQETGEDWVDAALTLLTAVPATSTVYPKLTTWKIGERDRFIPTPVAAVEHFRAPPPAAPPLPRDRDDEVLRRRLLARAVAPPATVDLPPRTEEDMKAPEEKPADKRGGKETKNDEDGRSYRQRRVMNRQIEVSGRVTADVEEERGDSSRPSGAPAAPAAPPPAEPTAMYDSVSKAEVMSAPASRGSWFSRRTEYVPEVPVGGLSPPPGYRRPVYSPDLPAALAGGYDLAFPSLRPETVKSGKGARRVALFAETWPVAVERRLMPAVAPDAFLVAEIKNPSSRVLPGGKADLFVGADPAGTAQIKLVAPGEVFTLPLGLDRAIKPVRNVKLVLAEKGVFSKDELSEYLVTTEIANPYRAPLAVRLIDQIPVTGEKEIEIKLGRTDPGATVDPVKGSLEWRFTVPPSGKSTVSFVYTLRRPKGYRLHQ